MLGITLKETRVYREIKEEGREAEARNLVLRLLMKRFGKLSGEVEQQVSTLKLPALEDLSEALLDFRNVEDLQAWLERI